VAFPWEARESWLWLFFGASRSLRTLLGEANIYRFENEQFLYSQNTIDAICAGATSVAY
jgi:hypothetical protein